MSGMNYDHYKVAKAIASNLRQNGETTWANKIEDAIKSGSTGTEIHMALRWQLQQLRNADVECSSEAESLIDALLREIDKSLQ